MHLGLQGTTRCISSWRYHVIHYPPPPPNPLTRMGQCTAHKPRPCRTLSPSSPESWCYPPVHTTAMAQDKAGQGWCARICTFRRGGMVLDHAARQPGHARKRGGMGLIMCCRRHCCNQGLLLHIISPIPPRLRARPGCRAAWSSTIPPRLTDTTYPCTPTLPNLSP